VTLKSLLDQNSIVIYKKSNGDFNATSILEGHKRDIRRTSSITNQNFNLITLTDYYTIVIQLDNVTVKLTLGSKLVKIKKIKIKKELIFTTKSS
jgi:hypothetical protein